ncbi:hypothetical protein SUFG_00030 [Sulfitobacter phage phiCB2047-B]|uniref:Uncharacterized protein n=1 Tax=Sulfitobacter phage phiCB2047-B TaxID=754046 RepID=M4PYH1_9CAUD|nr:hypothetical protein SUFG_00030 [Sulfitobacter phage phiCB2047-B]AGH07399.1 hypothetical protein SUFG_00030 [Sulfitobacter phage phiCB2047-B]
MGFIIGGTPEIVKYLITKKTPVFFLCPNYQEKLYVWQNALTFFYPMIQGRPCTSTFSFNLINQSYLKLLNLETNGSSHLSEKLRGYRGVVIQHPKLQIPRNDDELRYLILICNKRHQANEKT